MVTIESPIDVDAPSRSSVRPAAIVAAAASLGAAAIHLWVVPEHRQEWWVYAAFFIAVAACQALTAVLVVAKPVASVLWFMLLGNLAVIVIWVMSRTVGVPLRPTPLDGTSGRGDPFLGGYGEHAARGFEPVGVLDLASTVLEIIVVICVLLLLPATASRRRIVNLVFVSALLMVLARIIAPFL